MLNYFASKAGSVVQGFASKFKMESEGDKGPESSKDSEGNIAKLSAESGSPPKASKDIQDSGSPKGKKEQRRDSPKEKLQDLMQKDALIEENKELKQQLILAQRNLCEAVKKEEQKEELHKETIQKIIEQRDEALGESKRLRESLIQQTKMQEQKLKIEEAKYTEEYVGKLFSELNESILLHKPSEDPEHAKFNMIAEKVQPLKDLVSNLLQRQEISHTEEIKRKILHKYHRPLHDAR